MFFIFEDEELSIKIKIYIYTNITMFKQHYTVTCWCKHIEL